MQGNLGFCEEAQSVFCREKFEDMTRGHPNGSETSRQLETTQAVLGF